MYLIENYVKPIQKIFLRIAPKSSPPGINLMGSLRQLPQLVHVELVHGLLPGLLGQLHVQHTCNHQDTNQQ